MANIARLDTHAYRLLPHFERGDGDGVSRSWRSLAVGDHGGGAGGESVEGRGELATDRDEWRALMDLGVGLAVIRVDGDHPPLEVLEPV